MSDTVVSSPSTAPATPWRRGQSLVEFALVLPMLIVLLLGVADFGRVFQAGIVTEAAARNGAEAAALERLRADSPGSLDPSALPDYYARLHEIAAEAACAEARTLPNTTYVDGDADNAGTCPSMPVIAVCVQDGSDPNCGALAPGFSGTPPPECTELFAPWAGYSGGMVGSHSVEVRICYRFTTLFNLNIQLPMGWGLSLGDIYLQRSRSFIVDCPPGDVSGC